MNLIEHIKFRLYTNYKIQKELKRINEVYKDLETKIKSNPSLASEQVSEENKKILIEVLENIIKYKFSLGLDCTKEKQILEEAKNNL